MVFTTTQFNGVRDSRNISRVDIKIKHWTLLKCRVGLTYIADQFKYISG